VKLRAAIVLVISLTLLAGLLPACASGENSGTRTPDGTVTIEASALLVGVVEDCEPVDDPRSVARRWNEATLNAIRRDFPAPTVHARNLFHVSTAMWDAWTAYDADPGSGMFVDEAYQFVDQTANDHLVDRAREIAMSFAAYRVLAHRYSAADGAPASIAEFDTAMRLMCLSPDEVSTKGTSPAELGNRIAATTIEAALDDGSNEDGGYVGVYESVNPGLAIGDSGTSMVDPNRWQPLVFEFATTQNGIIVEAGPQTYVGPHWGSVTPFALDLDSDGLPIDPGPPLYLEANYDEFAAAVVEVLDASARLDPFDTNAIDVGPASRGNSSLGTNDGSGHPVNPSTGEPYEPNLASEADWARVVAEFWADGPESETPPGHWNTLANEASDAFQTPLKIAGEGPEVDRLEWDVRLYLALNGALHDAAIAAWGAKATYDYSRPISMIRYMGGLGQSSDAATEPYHEHGLPLVEGLIEVVTAQSSAPGEQHERLADHIGEIAVRTWTGESIRSPIATMAFGIAPAAGVDWIRAVDWMPYQRISFVTPAFPGYVSGHSTFSRAGAEVLTAFTGDAFFPGGLGEHDFERDSLRHELGPTQTVTLQWATYRDAADEAGRSRIWGGIHVEVDDVAGRVMGERCGRLAWQRALAIWAGR